MRGLSAQPPVVRWQHRIASVDDLGRVTLPTDVRSALDLGCGLRAVSRDAVLLLRVGTDGAAVQVDCRGRFVLPMWLRTEAAQYGSVLLAARLPELSCDVVMSPTGLDRLVNEAAGEAG